MKFTKIAQKHFDIGPKVLQISGNPGEISIPCLVNTDPLQLLTSTSEQRSWGDRGVGTKTALAGKGSRKKVIFY